MADLSIHGTFFPEEMESETTLTTDRDAPTYDNANCVRLNVSDDTITVFNLDRPTADALVLVARMTTEQRAEAVGLMRKLMEDRRDA